MQFQASDTLKSRTFIGLILSQFLAAFNDQAIHASAMFYAIRKDSLTEAQAISLMPILFFAPWAIFCTLAGYLADRYSKRSSLVFWKAAEVGITLVALAGFWLGSHYKLSIGPWIVLSTVFLMGMHSAFFVPAKYGVMPEILQPTLLSKGNGVLESTSFLAVILGTVSGGVLSSIFHGEEYKIGLILVALAGVGVVCSLLIQPVPAANPSRPFPTNLFKPLLENLKTLQRSKPLALAVLGIAFFTFMVAFMRATMYMHGESQNPRWNEFDTSLVVAVVALGVGLGSPLAGMLSGGKIELGLVPLGAVGMILSCLVAAFTLFHIVGLIICLIFIGFFSGFYIVPLYTLLQHRAPKASKGDLIATSNFVNVTGAIMASLLFFALFELAKLTGIARAIPQEDVAVGILEDIEFGRGGHTVYIRVKTENETVFYGRRRSKSNRTPLDGILDDQPAERVIIDPDDDVKTVGSEVAVSEWLVSVRGVKHHYELRSTKKPLEDAYDTELVPRFLFIGAALMTLGILILLCRQLPDFFVRALLWIRSHGRYRLHVAGLNHLPSDGPALLATNCDRFESCMQVVASTDRFTRFILVESEDDPDPSWLLRYLAKRTGLVVLHPGRSTREDWEKAYEKAAKELDRGNLVGLTFDQSPEMEHLLRRLRKIAFLAILPVHGGPVPSDHAHHLLRGVNVIIGEPLNGQSTIDEIRESIQALGTHEPLKH